MSVLNFCTTHFSEYCFLDSDIGPCRAYDPRWYYNRTDGSCQQFMYGGCPGNGNNFKTVDECQEKCGDAQGMKFKNDKC